jgi:polysaccharide pyruvyl transferase WcaK-like protein
MSYKEKHMDIGVLGWYGKKNIGDDAFCGVIRDFFEANYGMVSDDVRFYTPPNKPEGDIIILGGGAVVAPFYLNLLPTNKPLYALGVSLEYESEANLIRHMPFKEIVVRQEADMPLLKDMPFKVTLAPDLAFWYKSPIKPAYDIRSRHVGVLLTDYIKPAIDRPFDKFGERYQNFIIEMAAHLDALIEEGYHVILYPCSTGGYGDDRRINLDVKAFMKHEPVIHMNTFTPQQLIDHLAWCDFTVCMRFHAHIFSAIAKTPMISITFTRKVKGFINENGLGMARSTSDDYRFTHWQEAKKRLHEQEPLLESLASVKRVELVKLRDRVSSEWMR